MASTLPPASRLHEWLLAHTRLASEHGAGGAASAGAPRAHTALFGRYRSDSSVGSEARRNTIVGLELFPARTDAGNDNLVTRIARVVATAGLSSRSVFISLTTPAATSRMQSAVTPAQVVAAHDSWLNLACRLQSRCGEHAEVLLHVTCKHGVDATRALLHAAYDRGIRNVLALRGDSAFTAAGRANLHPAQALRHASDLVALIRAEFGQRMCVCVCGYPEVHPEACHSAAGLPPSALARERDIAHLKTKVLAGADGIITQFVYDPTIFADWLLTVRASGLPHTPVIAGYMPLQAAESYFKLTAWCRTRVPPAMRADVERIKDDDAALAAYGAVLGAAHARALLEAGAAGVMFHTLNLAKTTMMIINGGGAGAPAGSNALSSTAEATRAVPGMPRTAWTSRAAEKLQQSLLDADAEVYPNGRWTKAGEPAFGELRDYYAAERRPRFDRRTAWGTPQSVADVARVFSAFLDGRVPELPWCDSAPAGETMVLVDNLKWLTKRGFLTINSQPRVNGAPSTHPLFGWGGPGGLVYQKAYLEFFASGAALSRLVSALPRYTHLSLHAFNASGEEYHSTTSTRANAVTWGVFAGREILQTTVMDVASMRAWKDEAFDLWLSAWASIYSDADNASDTVARRVLTDIHDSWYLINLVDNDFVSPTSDIFAILRETIAEGLSESELRLRVRDLEAEVARLREALRTAGDAIASNEVRLSAASERAASADAQNAQLRALLTTAASSGLLQPVAGGSNGTTGGGNTSSSAAARLWHNRSSSFDI